MAHYRSQPLKPKTARRLDFGPIGKLANRYVLRRGYRAIGEKFRDHDEIVSETICEALSALESLQESFPDRSFDNTLRHAVSLGYNRVRLRGIRAHKPVTLADEIFSIVQEENDWSLSDFVEYLSRRKCISTTMQFRLGYLATLYSQGHNYKTARLMMVDHTTRKLFRITHLRLRREIKGFLALWLS